MYRITQSNRWLSYFGCSIQKGIKNALHITSSLGSRIAPINTIFVKIKCTSRSESFDDSFSRSDPKNNFCVIFPAIEVSSHRNRSAEGTRQNPTDYTHQVETRVCTPCSLIPVHAFCFSIWKTAFHLHLKPCDTCEGGKQQSMLCCKTHT